MLLSLIIVLKTFGLNYVLNITLELKRFSMCQTKTLLKFCFFRKWCKLQKREVQHNTYFPVAPNF